VGGGGGGHADSKRRKSRKVIKPRKSKRNCTKGKEKNPTKIGHRDKKSYFVSRKQTAFQRGEHTENRARAANSAHPVETKNYPEATKWYGHKSSRQRKGRKMKLILCEHISNQSGPTARKKKLGIKANSPPKFDPEDRLHKKGRRATGTFTTQKNNSRNGRNRVYQNEGAPNNNWHQQQRNSSPL